MNKSEVIDTVGKTFWDRVIPSGRDLVLSEDGVIYDDTPVTDDGLKSAGEIVGLPGKIIDELPQSLDVDVLSYLLSASSKRPKALVRDNEIFKFINGGATLLQPAKVIDIIENSLDNKINFDRVYVGDKATEIYCTGPKQTAVEVGDPVQCGVYVAFSPYGELMPDVTSFLQHLACTNGMLSTRNLATFKKQRGDSSEDSIYDWLESSIVSAYNSVDDEIDRLKEMKNYKLNGNRNIAIEHILQIVPASLRKAVRNEIDTSTRPIRTMYDLYYIVTYFASHRINRPNNVRALMLMSGDIPDHIGACPTCHRRI